ncbi:MAG: ATP-binding cassette domain-containing protein [Actinomycetota bacterium]|jgi:branched-chain amino acid transport system ATP-binding protein
MTPPERPAALVVRDLSVRRGAREVLAGVSLSLDAGEVVILVGANGSGRSTLVSALAGLLPRQGQVTVAGRLVTPSAPASAVRAGLVAVPERRQLFAHLTVEDHLVLGLYALGPRLVRRARRAVEASGIYDLFPVLRDRRRQRAGTLSGGEQQMLALGRALISQPSVLLLDEPFLGLGPAAVRAVGESLANLRAGGRAVLLVDDQPARQRAAADRVLILGNGRLSASQFAE